MKYRFVIRPLLVIVSLGSFGAGLADSQEAIIGYHRPQGIILAQAAGHEVLDYFEVKSSRAAMERLRAVEQYHMNREVYQNVTSGKYNYALADIKFTLNYFPNHPTALQLLTTIAVLSKQRSMPIAFFERAVALFPQRAMTHAQYGHYMVSVGDLEGGIQKLKYATELDPDLIPGHVWLSLAYERKGDATLARKARERARELGYSGKFSDRVPK